MPLLDLSIFLLQYISWFARKAECRPSRDKQLKFSTVKRISLSGEHFVRFSLQYLQYLPPS